MNKKILSALMAIVMALSVSVTAFADTPRIVKPAATATTKTESQNEKKVIRKTDSDSKKTTQTKEEKKTTASSTAKATKSAAAGKLSSSNKKISLSYGSFSYPKNVTAKKVDKTAYDLIFGEGTDDAMVVRVRAFKRDTALSEEIVDENGLMYGMYTGFLAVTYLNKPASEVAKGIGSQQIRKEVIALFNKTLNQDKNSKISSYTSNKDMKGIQLVYLDKETSENCVVLHGKDYDYVVYGVTSPKNKDVLNKLAGIAASTLKEKK